MDMVNCSRLAISVVIVTCLCVNVRAQEDPRVVTGELYKSEIEKWRAEHEARFRSPSGWLALTGHYWLEPGDNRIGSTTDCTVQLPADAANNLSGHVRLNGNRVSIAIDSGGPLLVDDKESAKSDLPIDALMPESDCATKLAIGQRLKLQLVRRAGRFAIRVRDSESELIKRFKGKQWFETSEAYRVVARYVPFEQPKSVRITNIKGDVVDSAFAGSLEFEWNGSTYRLDAIEEAPDSLFIIFKDLTCGRTTYGAGRFVDVELPADKSSPIVLDFNKTYSPPCAWSPHTLCPLPPKQNHLPIAIQAGEKN